MGSYHYGLSSQAGSLRFVNLLNDERASLATE
jgi:hypothetical protein